MDVRLGPVLVIGATGKQGGAVANHLLERGIPIRAFVRDGGDDAARRLHSLGAEIAVGTLDESEDIQIAMAGCKGVYSVQTWRDGLEREVQQGIAVAEAAHLKNVDMLVYSSASGANQDTGVPHFESKYLIERRIQDLHLKALILRPVYFMENLLAPMFVEGMERGVLRFPLPPDKPLQMVAVTDIGEVAAQAFDFPGESAGRAIDLAGDELLMPEVAKWFGRKLGHEVRYEQMPLEEYARHEPERALMFDWLTREGYSAPIRETRILHPEMLTFQQWLNTVRLPVSAPV
jgi:uncharacterized protein YbjT (DUF2867 family)